MIAGEHRHTQEENVKEVKEKNCHVPRNLSRDWTNDVVTVYRHFYNLALPSRPVRPRKEVHDQSVPEREGDEGSSDEDNEASDAYSNSNKGDVKNVCEIVEEMHGIVDSMKYVALPPNSPSRLMYSQ